MLLALLVQAQATRNALLAKRDTFCSHHQQYVLILVQMDTMELPVTLVRVAILIVQFVRVFSLVNVPLVTQGTSCNLRQQHAIPVVQVDIGKILQTTFARLAMLLAQLARMELPLNVLPATRDIFDNRRRQLALILVQMDTMELPVTLVLPVMRIVQFVRAFSLVNVPLVNQGTSCSQLLQQPHVLIPVQVDIGRTLQTIFAHLAILLAKLARMEPTVNALPAKWDTFYNRHQQYALALVPLAIGRTLQVRLVLLVTLIAQFARVQAIINALPVNQDTFCSQLLQQPHVLTLVRMDIGRTLRTIFAHLAILLALFVRVQATLNAPLVNQGTSYSQLLQQPHVLIPVQVDIGRTLQTIFAHLAISLARFVWAEPTLNVLDANQGITCNHQQLVIAIVHLITVGTLLFLVVLSVMYRAQLVRAQAILNVLPASRGIFCNQHRRKQHVLILVQVDIGRTLQTTFAQNAMLLVQSARMGPILNVLPAN